MFNYVLKIVHKINGNTTIHIAFVTALPDITEIRILVFVLNQVDVDL
jgi:hypothetical protein